MSKDQQNINYTGLMAGVVSQVGCLTVVLILLALGAGLVLDRVLNTSPVFTILLMVGSVPVTLYVIVRLTLSAAAKADLAMTNNKKKQSEEQSEE